MLKHDSLQTETFSALRESISRRASSEKQLNQQFRFNSGRKRRIMNTNKNDKGFTLVELLIVIVILGILATVTVFAVRGITDQGQQSACDADQKTLETAVETWFAQYGGDAIPGDVTEYQNGDPVLATTATGVLAEGGFLVDEPAATNWTVSASGDLTAGTNCV
ncbi:MAG: prepilin-type N-terminal cleavage/methylation domain-containing protein [Ilumatobacter sp.]|uniref:type II secretion system protein n=1 Tax=Ilumatobacter sp. TaxID=1967498 RepID=UPI003299C46C